ncbi:MAG TPA: ComF family protein [Terriglobales bacterium]|nr:ComF family protein [Terriglobales bacterium]
MRPISGATCCVCGERLLSPYAVEGTAGETRCGLCRKAQLPFARAVAYGSYDGALRGLLHLLKYERVRPAANVLGELLAKAIERRGLDLADDVVIVPVPLHPRKLRQRGFNQSQAIAQTALKHLERRLPINSGLLKRVRETRSQIGLTRHQRRENMRGAFAVVQPEAITGRDVLLVDDVFTTGTTVSECARVLRRARASKVLVATVARTLKTGSQETQLSADLAINEQAMAS